MTDIVNPSFKRVADSFLLSGTIDKTSAMLDYVVASSDSPTILADDQSLNTSELKAFDVSTSTSSYNVSIEGGEAFIVGTWVARDIQTSLTLDSDTDGQTVYLGWVDGQTNDIEIGKDSAFATSDQKIPLWTFDTDLNGVYNVTDERQIGPEVDFFDGDADLSFDGSTVSIIGADGTNKLLVNNSSVESTQDFVTPQVSLGNQATDSDDAVRKDQFDSLDSTVSGKADDPHDNFQHTETYQTFDDVELAIDDHQANDIHNLAQPPQTHDNTAHSVDYVTSSGARSAVDGSTLTDLTVSGNFDTAHISDEDTAGFVNISLATRIEGALSMDSNQILSLGTPNSDSHAATKGYVDGSRYTDSEARSAIENGQLTSAEFRQSEFDSEDTEHIYFNPDSKNKDASTGDEIYMKAYNVSGDPYSTFELSSGSPDLQDGNPFFLWDTSVGDVTISGSVTENSSL